MQPSPQSPPAEPFYYNDLAIILSLFCCWPIGLVLMWSGNKWTQTVRIVVTVVFAVMMGVGLLAGPPTERAGGVGEARETLAVGSETEQVAARKPTPVVVETVKESCVELSRMFGASSQLSEVQKEELWKRFKGKRFDWALEVSEVHSGVFGGYTVQFKCSPSSDSLLYDIQVEYDAKAKGQVLQFMKGESYQVTGVLNRSGSLIGLSGKASD